MNADSMGDFARESPALPEVVGWASGGCMGRQRKGGMMLCQL